MKELLWAPQYSHLFEVICTGGLADESRCVAAVRKMYLSLWTDTSYVMHELCSTRDAPLLPNLHDYFCDNSELWSSARFRPLKPILEDVAMISLLMQYKKSVMAGKQFWFLSMLLILLLAVLGWTSNPNAFGEEDPTDWPSSFFLHLFWSGLSTSSSVL